MVSSRWLMSLLTVKSRERQKGGGDSDSSGKEKKTRSRGSKTKDAPVESSGMKPQKGVETDMGGNDENGNSAVQHGQGQVAQDCCAGTPRGGKGGKAHPASSASCGREGGNVHSGLRSQSPLAPQSQTGDQQQAAMTHHSSNSQQHLHLSHVPPTAARSKAIPSLTTKLAHTQHQKCHRSAIGNGQCDLGEPVNGSSRGVYILRGIPATCGPNESAAIIIQSAFRAYLARRALHTLRGLVKMQVGWCDHKGTWEDIKAALQSKHEGALKRERARAYAFSYQLWKNGSQNPPNSMSYLDCHPDRGGWGWTWLERWMNADASRMSRMVPEDGKYVDNLSKVVDGLPRSMKLIQPHPSENGAGSIPSSDLPDLGKCKSCNRRITARPGSQGVSVNNHPDLCNICTPTVSSAAKTVAGLQQSPKAGSMRFENTLRSSAIQGGGLSVDHSFLGIRAQPQGIGMDMASSILQGTPSKIKPCGGKAVSLDLSGNGSVQAAALTARGRGGMSPCRHGMTTPEGKPTAGANSGMLQSARRPSSNGKFERKSAENGQTIQGAAVRKSSSNVHDATLMSGRNRRPTSAPQQRPMSRKTSSLAEPIPCQESTIRRSSIPGAIAPRGLGSGTPYRVMDHTWSTSRASVTPKAENQCGDVTTQSGLHSTSHDHPPTPLPSGKVMPKFHSPWKSSSSSSSTSSSNPGSANSSSNGTIIAKSGVIDTDSRRRAEGQQQQEDASRRRSFPQDKRS